jgi:hypothetical protein
MREGTGYLLSGRAIREACVILAVNESEGVGCSMAYDARVLQILIASPGDVNEEREIISQVIHEWNYVYSRERSVVLLPLRWETHASPEMGSTPQAVINRQVVDYCDMAIGVFWTRLGTPTDEAESGTAEEIARVGDAGKPVMIYFSRAKASLEPPDLDLEELGRLREFKRRTYPKGLIESYGSLSDFREKLQRQLAIRIRDIIAESTPEQSSPAADGRNIVLTFAQGDPPAVLWPSNVIMLTNVICVDQDKIPDYTESEIVSISSKASSSFVSSPNRDYYREIVDYYRQDVMRRQLRLAVSSLWDQSVRDIYMEIRVRAYSGNILINPPVLLLPNRIDMGVFASFGTQVVQDFGQNQGQVAVEEVSEDEWRMEVSFPVIQAQRTVLSYNSFTLAATESSRATFDATVYSSDALPFPLSAEIDVRIEPVDRSYREILKQILPGYDED